MNRVLLVVGGVVIVAAAAVGGADWYLQKQVTTQINTALDLAKAGGGTATVDSLKAAHFGKGVTLAGIKISQGATTASIGTVIVTLRLGGPLGLTPTGFADVGIDTAAFTSDRLKASTGHLQLDNLDLDGLAAILPTINKIADSKTAADLQGIDWSVFAHLKADHVHADKVMLHADHAVPLPEGGDTAMTESFDTFDMTGLVNGTVASETADGVAFEGGKAKSTLAHMTTTNVDYTGLAAAIPVALKMIQIKTPDDLKGLDWSAVYKMKVEHFHADHLTAVADDTGVKVNETVDAMDLSGFANGVIGSETLDGLSETISMDGSNGTAAGAATVTLHHAQVDNLTLPKNYDDVFPWARNLFGITNFSMDGMSISSPDLTALAKGGPATVSIGKIHLDGLQRDKGMILGGTFAIEAVSVPTALIDNDQALQVLNDLGLKTVDVTASFHTESDAAGQHAALGPISIDGKGLVGVTATMGIEGLGPYPDMSTTLPTEQKMQEMMMQLGKAKFKDLTVAISDHGLIHKMVADQAKASGQTVADLAATAPMMSAGLAPTLGDANASALGAAVGEMVGGKQSLKVHVTTKDPIPFEILGKVSTDPLPEGALTVDAKAE